METINLIARNPEAVRRAIEMGEIVHLDTASEEITDEFLLFAIDSGLLKKWALGFPDPRMSSEISIEVMLAASIAARFSGIYSMRKTGYLLRSALVLGALGYSVEVLEEGEGISLRGTSDDKALSGDVIRKMLVKLESRVEIAAERAEELKEKEKEKEELELSRELKVRERKSRREVKQAFDAQEAQERARAAAQELVNWYNKTVGLSILRYGSRGSGRRIHILDTTKIEVELETANYELSGVVRNEDGSLSRGYKLATLRTLLETAGIMSAVEIGPIERHDFELSKELLHKSRALRAGDLILQDRGLIDGQMTSWLKRKRQVDVIVPLRSDMQAFQEARDLALLEGNWQPHPSRADEQIAFVRGVEQFWDTCTVELNACVIRFQNEKKKGIDFIVLVTTDLSLQARWIVAHYEERPEVEQDYQQMKSGGWLLKKLSSTRYTEIVFYILTIVLSYSLYHLFTNTQAGSRFANKTRQAIAFEQRRTHRTHIIVYAGGYFDIYETLRFMHLILRLPLEIQYRVRSWLDRHFEELEEIQKRE
jgi:hypothetical protein